MALGILAVALFSVTLPATRAAVAGFDPLLVAFARAEIAAMFAALVLYATRARWPTTGEWRSLAVVATGVVLGFPLLTSWAMAHVPASYGAVVLAALPLATAVAGVVRAGERPTRSFWAAAVAGSVLVAGWALAGRSDAPPGTGWATLALAGSVVAAGVGYAEGARLARTLGGWQVICWALVLTAPILVVPTVALASNARWPTDPSPWIGLLYVALVSQLAAFFPWYRGLALGGIARVGQAQLLQPFFTLVAAALLLSEPVAPGTIAIAAAVVLAVALSARAGQARSGGVPVPAGTMNSRGLRRRRASHARPSARRSPGAKP